MLAGLLHRPAGDLDLHLGFAEIGVDSLMATRVVQALEERLGARLHPTLLFEHPTPGALIAHLRGVVPAPRPAAEALPAGDVDAWIADRAAGLVRGAVAVRDPGPGEVTIEPEAWGLNFIDVLASTGLHPVIDRPRFVPGHEIAGTVVAVGPGVDDLRVGDAVLALADEGGLARRVTVPRRLALRRPAGLSAVDAASVLVTGLTALACVEDAGRVGPGDRVLIQSAAGATGTACVQIALHHGAVVIGTAGSDEKVAHLAAMGVQHPVNYATEPFDEAVRSRTGEVDVIVDALSGDAIPRGLAVLAEGGRFVEIGLGEAVRVDGIDPRRLFLRGQTFSGTNLGALMRDAARLPRLFARLLAALDAGALRPAVGTRLPFDAAPEALDRLRGRRTIGKVVLVR